ncbi:unnamed protein product [Cuscuta europaea]|nr:unnamed protein product [Cuscuta europaea]
MPFKSRRMTSPWPRPKGGSGRQRRLPRWRGRLSRNSSRMPRSWRKPRGGPKRRKQLLRPPRRLPKMLRLPRRRQWGKRVAAFIAEGWKAEAQRAWVATVVESSVEEWVKGPGAMWLAQKGKEYYDGGEYFTQALIYRRLARHLGADPSAFDPATYGLPPLQPGTRVPLPEGTSRPDLEDTVLMAEFSDEEEDAEGDATSKPADGGDAAAADDVVIV